MNLRSEVILVARPWTNGRTARHMKDAIDNAIACADGYDRIQEVLNEYFLGLEYYKLLVEIDPLDPLIKNSKQPSLADE